LAEGKQFFNGNGYDLTEQQEKAAGRFLAGGEAP
jgi:hypothetical protein